MTDTYDGYHANRIRNLLAQLSSAAEKAREDGLVVKFQLGPTSIYNTSPGKIYVSIERRIEL